MNITGTQTIAAPRQRVWDALNDPAILQRSLPGCESVERLTPEHFKVAMVAAIGPLRARFDGELRMSDIQAPAACTMVFEGQGGAVGFGKGRSQVTLEESAEGTTLHYTAQAQLGGKLAQIGSRMIDSVARKMANDFFSALKAQLAPPSAEPPAAAAPEAAAPETPVTDAPERPDGNAARPTSLNTGPVLVPGWWLLVAALIGSGATLAGLLLTH